jgi:hypothetical protein
MEFINRPRTFRPGRIVENIKLENVDGRTLKGELVFGLANRAKHIRFFVGV